MCLLRVACASPWESQVQNYHGDRFSNSDGGRDRGGETPMAGKVIVMKRARRVKPARKRISTIKAKQAGTLRRESQRTEAVVEHHRKYDPAICEVDDCSGTECFFCKACGVKLCPSHISEELHPCKQWRRLDYYFSDAQRRAGGGMCKFVKTEAA